MPVRNIERPEGVSVGFFIAVGGVFHSVKGFFSVEGFLAIKGPSSRFLYHRGFPPQPSKVSSIPSEEGSILATWVLSIGLLN